MFSHEVELLEMRINHMWEWVDYFVIVEADVTHRNEKKDYLLPSILNTDLKWAKDKIIYLQFSPNVTDDVFIENQHYIDNEQRNYIMMGLHNSDPNDIIMISDLDEFPNYTCLKLLKDENFHVCIDHYICSFKMLKFRRIFEC
jgi:beta-1,4-mannosyl-glycoprotein beta-1,4-N-acetylglucosaminyltransferase